MGEGVWGNLIATIRCEMDGQGRPMTGAIGPAARGRGVAGALADGHPMAGWQAEHRPGFYECGEAV